MPRLYHGGSTILIARQAQWSAIVIGNWLLDLSSQCRLVATFPFQLELTSNEQKANRV
jgi:hypothetical protein